MDDYIGIVLHALHTFYENDGLLIDKNLCERCMVHRIAFYLQIDSMLRGYYVDCEFNKAYFKGKIDNKVLSSPNGNYVDIIVHRRTNTPLLGDNLLCFEVKKYSNKRDRDKDRDNLKLLTSPERFSYNSGFYIILGKTYEQTIVELYQRGCHSTTYHLD